jgi:hypothetical protein
MDRDSMNDTQASAALGPQTRKLTEAELDAVFGGSFSWGCQTTSIQWSGSGGAGASNAIIAILIG